MDRKVLEISHICVHFGKSIRLLERSEEGRRVKGAQKFRKQRWRRGKVLEEKLQGEDERRERGSAAK